jgi:hypothetical protein
MEKLILDNKIISVSLISNLSQSSDIFQIDYDKMNFTTFLLNSLDLLMYHLKIDSFTPVEINENIHLNNHPLSNKLISLVENFNIHYHVYMELGSNNRILNEFNEWNKVLFNINGSLKSLMFESSMNKNKINVLPNKTNDTNCFYIDDLSFDTLKLLCRIKNIKGRSKLTNKSSMIAALKTMI